MDPPKKLTTRQQAQEQEQLTTAQNLQSERGLEFASVEAMLRHDALHTPVPPSVAFRLQESVAKEPPLPIPWWRRLFGGGNK